MVFLKYHVVKNFLFVFDVFLCIVLVSCPNPLSSELFHTIHGSFIWICQRGQDDLFQSILEDSYSGVPN